MFQSPLMSSSEPLTPSFPELFTSPDYGMSDTTHDNNNLSFINPQASSSLATGASFSANEDVPWSGGQASNVFEASPYAWPQIDAQHNFNQSIISGIDVRQHAGQEYNAYDHFTPSRADCDGIVPLYQGSVQLDAYSYTQSQANEQRI